MCSFSPPPSLVRRLRPDIAERGSPKRYLISAEPSTLHRQTSWKAAADRMRISASSTIVAVKHAMRLLCEDIVLKS
ncbi:hypothetical protein Y032_0451g1690 [Ancylostoma ceylanicum]|uniref:Uncharacterized protein n=1 Tax=Ancylostoma ceylanicum TaxID=53326 RepID=A0A016X0G0_9BILA|nr:hypothetical protein Y032_0451g1690 [Ancylostoma ceylanicum]